jgi:ribosomal protein S18 acetylase RimI-like enzyme
MSITSAIETARRAPALVVRRITRRDLARLRELAQESGISAWSDRNLAILRPRDAIGWLAEVDRKVVGFVVCRVLREHAASGGFMRRLAGRLGAAMSGIRQPLRVDLLELSVNEHAGDVERTLLEHLHLELRRAPAGVRIVVPETNLTAQLYLRDAWYRATRVLPGYCGSEDGYLMVR